MSSIQIVGLADLLADFERLAKSQSTKALRRATVAGAKVIRDEARKRAPKKTGKLRRNIVSAALRRRTLRAWRQQAYASGRRARPIRRTTRFIGASTSSAHST